MAFPSFFVLSFSDLHLCTNFYCPDLFKGEGLLVFFDGNVYSPNVKFAAEKSKTGDPSLVHIRSCFNNKYWVANEDAETGEVRIYASANKPHEDTTDPACTLFRVSTTNNSNGVFEFFSVGRRSLQVVQGGACLKLKDNHFKDGEALASFPITDWETLVQLPSQVTFRSEALDGKYLCSRVVDGGNHHTFESGLDMADPQVAYELNPTSKGYYTIKSLHHGNHWRGNPEWIVADVKYTYTQQGWNSKVYDDRTLFSFTKIRDNVYALSNLVNKRFCGGAGADNRLSASYPGISKETRLIVEERVLKRVISKVRYRLSDALIHDEEVQQLVNEFATNNSHNKEQTVTLEFSQTHSTTSTWNNSESSSFGASVDTGFEVDEVPFVAKTTLQVELSTQEVSSGEWGRSNTEEKTSKAVYTVSVPPLSTMKVSLMVTKAACEVPFSYTENLLLSNGERLTKEKDDGFYKGIRTLNFYLENTKVDYNPHLGKLVA